MYDYLEDGSEYYVFPIGEQLETETLRLFWMEVLKKQVKKNIKIKTLPNKKLKGIFEEYYKDLRFVEVRYTSQSFPTGIFIFKDYVLQVIWDEKPVAFLIKSKKNSLKWMKFFKEKWKTSKK